MTNRTSDCNEWGAFFLGMICGMLVFGILITTLPSLHGAARDAIKECEKSLPRDQVCIVTATPKPIEVK